MSLTLKVGCFVGCTSNLSSSFSDTHSALLLCALQQGINMQLIGVVGRGHDGSACSVTAISFAVFDAQQNGTGRDIASNRPVYSKVLNLTAGSYNHVDFTWTQNATANFYTDVYDIYDDKVNALGFNLTTNRYYW